MRGAIYSQVSTLDQDYNRQTNELKEYAKFFGIEIYEGQVKKDKYRQRRKVNKPNEYQYINAHPGKQTRKTKSIIRLNPALIVGWCLGKF